MKFSVKLLLVSIPFILLSSCENNPGDISVNKEKISGYVQKGPFLIGTSISLSELDSDLSQTGLKYSLAVEFPIYDEPSISFQFSFNEVDVFTLNPEELGGWTVQQDSSVLEISATGKDINSDMSIIFNKPGSFELWGDNTYKTGKIY